MFSLLTWGIGEGLFLYFIPLHLQNMGANPVTIGIILGAFGLMMAVVHIPAGYLSDRIGRKPLLLASWILGLLAAIIMAFATSLWTFVAGYLLYGLTAFVFSPLFSYVTAARGKLTTGRAMTLTSAMYNVGAVLGPVSGGWIGDRFGLQANFQSAAVVLFISTVMIFFLKAQDRDEHDEDSRRNTLFANPRFISFVGLLFIGTFVMFLPQPLTPNFLQNERGIGLGTLGWIGSAGSMGNAVFNLLLGQMNARMGYLIGQALVGVFALILWKGAGIPLYLLGYFLLGGFRAARVLGYAQVRTLIHPAQMGLAYGFTETFGSSAFMLAPILAGYLYDWLPVSVYPISIALTVGAMILYFINSPREEAHLEPGIIGEVIIKD